MSMMPPTHRRSLTRLAFRWLSGRPLNGRWRTDSTFLRPATVACIPGQLSGRWDHMAGWRRSAWRQAALAAATVLPWQYLTHPARTAILGAAGGLTCAALVGRRVARAWPDRQHYRSTVRPLHLVLARDLALPRNTRPADYLDMPVTFADDESTPIVVHMPAGWASTEANRKRTAGLVLNGSGQTAATMDTEWTTRGTATLIVRRAPAPPDTVAWADVVSDVEQSRSGDLVLGAGMRGDLYRWDLNTEDAHAGFSILSGRGKSSLLQVMAAQVIRPGGTVTAIDPKMVSFEDMVGAPRFRLANDPADVEGMWQAIAEVRGELERRRTERAADRTADWPVRVLMIDELNQFSAMSKMAWMGLRNRDDSLVAPVWGDVATIAQMGRAFRCHLVLVGQSLTDRATGGNDIRHFLGFRALAGWTPAQWKMLSFSGGKSPEQYEDRGRWLYLTPAGRTWVQNAYAEPGELLSWLGAECPMSHVPANTQVSAVHGTPIVGLDAAAAHLGVPVETFRKRRQRAGGALPGEGRQGNRPTFTAASLDAAREGQTVA